MDPFRWISKDIIRLLLIKYLDTRDAISCFLTIPVFHHACDAATLSELKRRYFKLFRYGYHDPVESVQEGMCFCSCGVLLKPHNAGIHRRKCKIGRAKGVPIPDRCPDCDKSLYNPKEFGKRTYVFVHHLLYPEKYCVATSTTLRRKLIAERAARRLVESISRLEHTSYSLLANGLLLLTASVFALKFFIS